MFTAVILSASLIVITSMFHYSVLRWLAVGMSRISMSAQWRMLAIIFAVFVTHIGEIALYAAAYAVSVKVLGLGSFGGLVVEGTLDYFYFSIVIFTSLGLGDVFPNGHLRFITGIEALNGLVLIAWSASFIYLAMGHLWPWEVCVKPRRTVFHRQRTDRSET